MATATLDLSRFTLPHSSTGTRFSLTIGPVSRTYELLVTAAPRSYDRFGTMTVADLGECRYVLVVAEYREDHLDRYASGLHAAAPSVDFDADTIARLVLEGLPRAFESA